MSKKKSAGSAGSVSALAETAPDMLRAGALPSGFIEESQMPLVDGIIVKSMSPLIKPGDFPVDRVFVGRFTKIFETNPSAKKKGEGIEIVPLGAPVGIALPAVATVRQGLEITGSGEDAKSPYLGRVISVKRLSERIKSKKGQAAWHFVIAIYPEGYGK